MTRLFAFSLVLALASTACLPQPQGTDAQGRSVNVSVGGSGTAGQSASGQTQTLPDVFAPETELLRMEREFSVLGIDGVYEHFSEVLLADGQGEFRLDVVGWAAGNTTNRWAPSGETIATYERRQRYLVRYRDLHLGLTEDVVANYSFHLSPQAVSIAGRLCHQYSFHSRNGFGDLTLLVDQDTSLLMGWTLFNPDGVEVMKSEVTALDFAPDLSGVVWSEPTVAQDPFQSPGDETTLGFAPLQIHYTPPGFQELHEKMLLTEALFQDIPNIHLTAFSDGLRTLFIAQQAPVGPSTGNTLPGDRVHFARESAIGGIRVIDGEIRQQPVFVVGALPSNELVGVFGSIDQ